ncbi:MAG: rhomboid family intramembrane serine protease [Deltaproteobacteria bacterium]|nr:rhomboid family intramembrane serine protease [Deltaproteobacteria bacterium]
MIIPIGHDQGVFRVPYVTATIIALCLLLQAFSCSQQKSDFEVRRLSEQRQLLLDRAWRHHGSQYVKLHLPELNADLSQLDQRRRPPSRELRQRAHQLRRLRARFARDFAAGKVADRTDANYRALKELDAQAFGSRRLFGYAYRSGAPLYTLITHAFLHGGWLHVVGNMLFLWMCGCNIEDRWGRLLWTGLYLSGAAISALTFAATRGFDSEIPLIGASGAVAAAMGAFLVLYHRTTIRLAYAFFYAFRFYRGVFQMRALWALPLWFGQQLIGMALEGPLVPVAYSAHVGGFVFGVGFALAMRGLGIDRRIQVREERKATVFEEHPLFVEALRQRDAGNHAQAEQALKTLLLEDPNHLDASLEHFRLTLPRRDLHECGRAASKAALLCRRAGDFATTRQVYSELKDACGKVSLTPRALFAIAEAFGDHDPKIAAELFATLANAYPSDPLAPRARLFAARILAEKLALPHDARAQLERVIVDQRESAFADQARRQLAELAQRG